MPQLLFAVGDTELPVDIRTLIIGGWTGRNLEMVEEHILELAELGVARPKNVPCFYRLGSNLLTTSEDIEVCGEDSSGEVEFMLVSAPEGLFVGVGSDLTDRKVEAYGVTVSKQVCPKPIARELWRYEEVADHWDQLILRSWVTRGGKRSLYQEGPVSRMRTPEDLIRLACPPAETLEEGTLMFCGTLPVQGQIGFSETFEIELSDPVLKRALNHTYHSHSLAFAD